MAKTTVTITEELPMCDICHSKKAAYDAKTVHGPWAYLCESCFKKVGVGLGLGKGQKLINPK